MAGFFRARGARPAGRRLGRDEERDIEQELADLRADPDADIRDFLAAIVNQCDPDQIAELSAALREITESMDRGGGLARWGEDRALVRDGRRRARDARRRMGRDDENLMPPRGSVGGENELPRNGIERMQGEDRRGRLAGDRRMAYDSSPQGLFRRLIPGAARVERA